MKLLANENYPLCAVEALQANGQDVLWVVADMAGARSISFAPLVFPKVVTNSDHLGK